MHQTKYQKKSLERIKLAMRVFFLSVLLMGNTFIFISALASSQIFAQGATQMKQQHMMALQPYTVASANKGLQAEKHTGSQTQKERTIRQPVALNSSGNTSAAAAATPLPQNLSIAANVQGGPTFQVGQTLTFVLTVTNISSTTTRDTTSGVRITDLIQLGLNNITGTASSGWNIVTSTPNSPSLIQATYVGPPVAPGASFPQVTISGILTSDAAPTISNTAGVSDNANPNLSFATFSVNVSPSIETATVTPTAPTSNPDVSLSFNVHGGPTFQVGQTLTFDLIVTNISTTVLDATSGVNTGAFTVPGLSNITAGGSGWTVIATAQNSPTFVEGIYGGPPVLPGGTFAPFQISATLNDAAVPAYTNTGGTSDTQFTNPYLATLSVSVSPAASPTGTVPPTATVPPTGTVPPTATVPPTGTVPPTETVPPIGTVSPTGTVPPIGTVSPTGTVPPSPTVTGTPSPTVTPPQLSIVSSSPGGNISAVGQTVNYQLVVTNLTTSLAKNQPIIVQDVLPVGLTNIAATGNGWSITLSNTISPTLITATYIGLYPVAPGSVLPALSISGTLTATAGPSFTNTASVSSPDDPNPNPALNTSTQTITIVGSTASPTATATPTLPGTPSSSPTTTVPPTLLTGATATTVPGIAPNVSIVQSHLGGDHFHVGDTISYVLIVSSTSAVADPISVTDVMPLGLSHMKVVAPGWLISLSDHSSPAVITASYSGISPSTADLGLSPIIITGVLDGDAVPSLTNTATVDIPGNSDVYNTTATDTVFVDDTSTTQNNDDNNNNHQNNNDNNNHQNNNNDNNHQNNNNDNNHQNNNDNNNNNHQNNNSSSNNASFPGLPATGSDPA